MSYWYGIPHLAPRTPSPPRLALPPQRVKRGEVYENGGHRVEVVRVSRNTVRWRALGGVHPCQVSFPDSFSDWVRHADTRKVRGRHCRAPEGPR